MLSATFPSTFWAAIKVSKCISADWTKIVTQNTHEVVLTLLTTETPGTIFLVLEHFWTIITISIDIFAICSKWPQKHMLGQTHTFWYQKHPVNGSFLIYFQWLNIMPQFGTVLSSYQAFYMLYADLIKMVPKNILGGIATYFLQKHLEIYHFYAVSLTKLCALLWECCY